MEPPVEAYPYAYNGPHCENRVSLVVVLSDAPFRYSYHDLALADRESLRKYLDDEALCYAWRTFKLPGEPDVRSGALLQKIADRLTEIGGVVTVRPARFHYPGTTYPWVVGVAESETTFEKWYLGSTIGEAMLTAWIREVRWKPTAPKRLDDLGDDE